MAHALYSDDEDDDQALREFLQKKYNNITVSNNTSSTRNLLANFRPQPSTSNFSNRTPQSSLISDNNNSSLPTYMKDNDEDAIAYKKFLTEKGTDLATRASLNTTSSRNILAGVDWSCLSNKTSTAAKETNYLSSLSSSTTTTAPSTNGSLLAAPPKLKRENSSMMNARPMLRRENSVMIGSNNNNKSGVSNTSHQSEEDSTNSDRGSLLRVNSSMGLARKPGLLRRENSSMHALKSMESTSEQQQQPMVKVSNAGTRKGVLHRENSIVGKSVEKTNQLKSSHLNQSMPVISQVSPARRAISKRLLTNYSQNALHDIDDSTSVMTTDTDKVSLHEMETEVKITHNSELAKVNCLVSQFLACGFPIMVFDKNGTVEYLNHEAEKTFGVYSFSALGENLHEFFLQNSVSEIHQAIHEFFNSTEEETSNHHSSQQGSSSPSTASTDLNYYNNLPLEKQLERKNALMKSRTLRGKSSLRNKFFVLTTRIVPVVKCEEIHFAAYMKKHPIIVKDSKAQTISRCAQVITDLMIIPIISITDHGIIQTFNNAACSTFGYKSYQVLGRNVKMICNAKDRARHDSYLEKYRHTREKRVLDRVTRVKGQTKTGKVIPLEIRVAEVLEPHGKSSFVAYLRDYRTLATAEESAVRIACKMYPKSIAERLELEERVVDTIPKCSILYCELLGISDLVKARSSRTVVRSLNEIFSKFEQISSKLGIEQMKVVGDGYMMATGIDKSEPGHAEKLIKAAIEMIRFVRLYASQLNEHAQHQDDNDFEIEEIALKVGIHSSSDIVAATIGKRKPTFDLFGEGVEISKILTVTGKPNQCHISNDCYKEVTSEKLLRGFVEHFREAEQVYLENKSSICTMPQSTWITQI
ncbi:hypothetical protein C9374_000900 [Naegleria lovaniensis]|uniref:Guanylate cyclase domain-containing protein n=1 Tax=Naegleria lovaniensis TaxID=51637 RepID=A0AA88GW43_NAELO|nr:uncharacterized protein C9374_000900 [Naegleria lovaniensis]KAG2388050.1 hypothetical protein C9374_000900 [Naegleria lovaniensis]